MVDESKRPIVPASWVLEKIQKVHAHQLRIVFDRQNSIENPIIIEEPEISKAYYGSLAGTPDFYKIESFQPFKLYLNILVPDLNDSKTDFMIEVSSQNGTMFILDGASYNWTKFYEKVAADNYLRGPEIEKSVSAGVHYIKVYNNDNKGKYSLAIGDIEILPSGGVCTRHTSISKDKKRVLREALLQRFF